MTNTMNLSDRAAHVLRGFDRCDAASGNRNYVLLHDLRVELSGISRPELDALINELRRARVLTLDESDGRHTRLSAAVLEAAIQENGARLVYVARRND